MAAGNDVFKASRTVFGDGIEFGCENGDEFAALGRKQLDFADLRGAEIDSAVMEREIVTVGGGEDEGDGAENRCRRRSGECIGEHRDDPDPDPDVCRMATSQGICERADHAPEWFPPAGEEAAVRRAPRRPICCSFHGAENTVIT